MDARDKLTWEKAKTMKPIEVVRHYFPSTTEHEAAFILWEKT